MIQISFTVFSLITPPDVERVAPCEPNESDTVRDSETIRSSPSSDVREEKRRSSSHAANPKSVAVIIVYIIIRRYFIIQNNPQFSILNSPFSIKKEFSILNSQLIWLLLTKPDIGPSIVCR